MSISTVVIILRGPWEVKKLTINYSKKKLKIHEAARNGL